MLKSRLYKKEMIKLKAFCSYFDENFSNFIEAARQRIFISELNILSRIYNKKNHSISAGILVFCEKLLPKMVF